MQMEELTDRCELLVELSACERIRDQTVQLQGTYTNIVTLLQVLIIYSEKKVKLIQLTFPGLGVQGAEELV
jgi:nesprin-1